ncbi:MBL fold metallo-hydrolase [Acidaminobacter sp. JC074]|uniref:MBL fold metallo-hydrolase n=1 Tax=Acidaminobacter sp. JC074 TaxID=2530199 RepID=UPI001F104B2A|nr:MBL fold metallo-hydrolase [Acidaminobacter sp. JC074]MCH4887327.1 MBL fold metallo-hydrolase [Acidaminobacter sp. JC074]
MTQVVLIGTGTPNPDPNRSGPCVGVDHNGKLYIVDFGVGLIRRINAAGYNISEIDTAFLTHLHSDHTLGLSDLIITPWILGRRAPLKLFGPKGTDDMAAYLLKAYERDIHERIHGLEKANTEGYKVRVEDLHEGIIYDGDIKVEAILVPHGNLEAYAFKFTGDQTIVISGDTAPSKKLIDFASGCDILVHEVYYAGGLKTRSPQWQKYHSSVHTSGLELGKIAQSIQPKKLVLYHQLFMQEHILDEDMDKNNEIYKEKILDEIRENFTGHIIYGEDLMIIR